MRNSCLLCVKKHIAQAIILLDECTKEVGYTSHRWLAVGHLSEAESETLKNHPEITVIIRKYKKRVEKGENPELLHIIEFILRHYDNIEINVTNSTRFIDLNGNEHPHFKKDKHGNWINLYTLGKKVS